MPIDATAKLDTSGTYGTSGTAHHGAWAPRHRTSARTYGHDSRDHFDRSPRPGQRPHPVRGADSTATSNAPPATGYTAGAPVHYAKLRQLADGELLNALRRVAAGRRSLDYREARRVLFSQIDNHGGQVRDVYTGRVITTHGIPPADGPDGVNTEHTYPKSRGTGHSDAVADLFHLFPTDSQANAQRGSYCFGEVKEVLWRNGEAKLGHDQDGRLVFEPPDAHKGNVARAMFYVSATYGLRIPDAEEVVLKRWTDLDPVDDAERQRNDAIAAVQGNRNPFIDAPDLAGQVSDF